MQALVGRCAADDSPLVVRLPEGEAGEGLLLPCGPAEGVLGSLVGEPWATAAKVGPAPKVPRPRRLPGLRACLEPAARCPVGPQP